MRVTCMSNQIVNAHNIIGINVESYQKEKLGKVIALMLDKFAGKVDYIVISLGSFLGINNKLLAMPWSIFSYNEERNCFLLHIPKEKLNNCPSFDKNTWPDMSNVIWKTMIQDYYEHE
ncbi:PRC-barrel domain-containing protein (plasmid) [Legionella sp. D16C41]|uniref:PRC-barrel domain-containing protein n=1 Tax=Legionella sp. D16C41 TaxID=3402688 RepID=UPI003AF44B4A